MADDGYSQGWWLAPRAQYMSGRPWDWLPQLSASGICVPQQRPGVSEGLSLVVRLPVGGDQGLVASLPLQLSGSVQHSPLTTTVQVPVQ